MICIVSRFWIPNGYNGLAFFPFIIVKTKVDRENKVLLNHEMIHIYQQLETFLLPFLIWYIIEFLVRLYQYKNTAQAYKNISFEREAYANDDNADYLKNRRLFSFLGYL